MRVANLAGRVVLLDGERAVDVATASDGRFGPDPMSVYPHWDDFVGWAASVNHSLARVYDPDELDSPVPQPAQVFAIGLNYSDHARESNLPEPADLVVFTKFPSCLTGPNSAVTLTSDTVDYETELVVVIGRAGREVDEESAWDYVAGLCVGQDISDRGVQLRGPAPQFSLGKSFTGFGPMGPAVVTLDEIPDRNSLRIRATVTSPDGASRVAQNGSTDDLIFSVASIISQLSQVVTLMPGDVIFTGTPAGVGGASGQFLSQGDVLTSEIEGLGMMRNEFVR